MIDIDDVLNDEKNKVIRAFPEEPDKPIIYYVYDQAYIKEAVMRIIAIHGLDYFDKHIEVRAVGTKDEQLDSMNISYFDPSVFTYRNNGYN